VFYGRVMGPLASPAGRLHAEIRVELPMFSLGRRFLSRYIRAAHFHVRESRKAAEQLVRRSPNLSYSSGARWALGSPKSIARIVEMKLAR